MRFLGRILVAAIGLTVIRWGAHADVAWWLDVLLMVVGLNFVCWTERDRMAHQ